MNAVAAKLAARIARDGPIGVDAYMAAALGDEDHGYYRRQDPLGRAGDFTTAPEISQMFGELIGLWCGVAWQAMGSPDPFHLVELGPGRGSLMADALRATRSIPGFADAAMLHLVETSPALRAAQQQRLPQAHFLDQLADLPPGPLILVANEFFDALPVRQYIKTEAGWRERRVDCRDGGFYPVTDAADQSAQVPEALRDATPGAMFEICPLGREIAGEIASRIRRFGGWALIIDYGHQTPGLGETLQAVKDHRFAPPFADPGEADLSAHVDFSALRTPEANYFGPIDQGALLDALGISARARKLKAANPRQAGAIEAAYVRLTHPGQMGRLFKALAVGPRGAPPPPGFAGEPR